MHWWINSNFSFCIIQSEFADFFTSDQLLNFFKLPANLNDVTVHSYERKLHVLPNYRYTKKIKLILCGTNLKYRHEKPIIINLNEAP